MIKQTLFFVSLSVSLLAQDAPKEPSNWLKNSDLEIIGAMNYYNFDWQTDSVRRNAIDNERLVFEYGYQRSEKLRFNTEIEIEHGGTGVSVEFDRFEEFGEFEFDVSKGGEVWVEQMNLQYFGNRWTLMAGRLKVPFSLWFDLEKDEPTDYATAAFSEAEAAILPNNWTENGLSLSAWTPGTNHFRFHLAVVNGLDNASFNSANWIKRGNQRRFELINAQSFAACARSDFYFGTKNLLGISAYYGNTSGNRPKPDLKVDAPLLLLDFHTSLAYKNLYFNGLVIYGSLGDSEAVTNANRNLSNNLNVKRTPLGAAALAGFVEVGMRFFKHASLVNPDESSNLLAYVRGDYYDTMFDTQGLVFNNPRWERKSFSAGIVWQLLHDVHLKLQYSLRKVGAPAPTSVDGGTLEKTFVAGMAFDFH